MAKDQVHCPECGRAMRLVMRRAGGQIVTHRECEPCGFTSERPPAPEGRVSPEPPEDDDLRRRLRARLSERLLFPAPMALRRSARVRAVVPVMSAGE